MSVWAVGLGLNTQVSVFATANYVTLVSTLQDESVEVAFHQPPLQPLSLPDGNGNSTQVLQCINTSQLAFNANNVYAALELLIVDQFLVNNAQTSIFTPKTDYPNPSGMLRQLVENQYFTIDGRINNGHPFPISKTPPVSPLPQPAYPPTISGKPVTHASVGVAYTFQPAASEFIGGPSTSTLTFSIVNKPSWASFSTTTGALTGTPLSKETDSGIVISVTDGCASKSLPAFSIKVTG